MKRPPTVISLACLLILGSAGPCAAASSRRDSPAERYLAGAREILESLQKTLDFTKATAEADGLFNGLVLELPPKEKEAYAEVVFIRRLLHAIAGADEELRKPLLALLVGQRRLALDLAFSIRPGEDPAKATRLLHRLYRERPGPVLAYPSLAVAVSVVHDVPLVRQLMENTERAPDALEVFDYFVENRKELLFDVRQMPPRLLIWLVDTTAPIEEMKWALLKYGGENIVGKSYFYIKYDFGHYRRGIPKKVSQAGYTLPNLLEYGGVCADQAYFATSVGKALGVPTVFAKAEPGQVFHAWVGFLQSTGGRSVWNFKAGRYRVYAGLKGTVIDPQTREEIPHSYVPVSAGLVGISSARRHQAAALVDGALRRADLKTRPEAAEDKNPRRPAIPASRLEHQLALIDAALALNPSDVRVWSLVGELAEKGELGLEQKKCYSRTLTRLFGKRYPDFLLDIYRKMVTSIDDAEQQDELWKSLYKMFSFRTDLAAEVLMARAEMWDRHGDTVKAGRGYETILKRYANDGPFALKALERTEEMLIKAGLAERVLTLYKQTWARMRKPKKIARQFRKKTNWYRCGILYKRKLELAEKAKEAQAVQKLIDQELSL